MAKSDEFHMTNADQCYVQPTTYVKPPEGLQYEDIRKSGSGLAVIPGTKLKATVTTDNSPVTTTVATKKVKTGKFTCYQCGYLTNRINNLKRHNMSMHENCEHMLECCGIRFANKANIRAHTFVCHQDGYGCAVCGRKFHRKALLKRHMAIHNDQKDFVCSECGYGTSHKSNLDRHKKVHQRTEKPSSPPPTAAVAGATSGGLVLPLKKRPYIPCKTKPVQRRNGHCKKNIQQNQQQCLPKDNEEMVPSPYAANASFQGKQNWTEMLPNSPEVVGPRHVYPALDTIPVNFAPQWPLTRDDGGATLYNAPYHNLCSWPQTPMSEPPFGPVSRLTDYYPANGPYTDPRISSGYGPFLNSGSSDSIAMSPAATSTSSVMTGDHENFGDRDSTRLRLFPSPYKCFACDSLFSTQMQLAYHLQCCHPHTDVVALSIVNVLRKMHLNQRDSFTMQATQPPMIDKHDMQTFLINI